MEKTLKQKSDYIISSIKALPGAVDFAKVVLNESKRNPSELQKWLLTGEFDPNNLPFTLEHYGQSANSDTIDHVFELADWSDITELYDKLIKAIDKKTDTKKLRNQIKLVRALDAYTTEVHTAHTEITKFATLGNFLLGRSHPSNSAEYLTMFVINPDDAIKTILNDLFQFDKAEVADTMLLSLEDAAGSNVYYAVRDIVKDLSLDEQLKYIINELRKVHPSADLETIYKHFYG